MKRGKLGFFTSPRGIKVFTTTMKFPPTFHFHPSLESSMKSTFEVLTVLGEDKGTNANKER